MLTFKSVGYIGLPLAREYSKTVLCVFRCSVSEHYNGDAPTPNVRDGKQFPKPQS